MKKTVFCQFNCGVTDISLPHIQTWFLRRLLCLCSGTICRSVCHWLSGDDIQSSLQRNMCCALIQSAQASIHGQQLEKITGDEESTVEKGDILPACLADAGSCYQPSLHLIYVVTYNLTPSFFPLHDAPLPTQTHFHMNKCLFCCSRCPQIRHSLDSTLWYCTNHSGKS